MELADNYQKTERPELRITHLVTSLWVKGEAGEWGMCTKGGKEKEERDFDVHMIKCVPIWLYIAGFLVDLCF